MNITVHGSAVFYLLQLSPSTRRAGSHGVGREGGKVGPPGVQVQPVRQNRKRFSYDVCRNRLVPELLVFHDHADGTLHDLRTRGPPREGGGHMLQEPVMLAARFPRDQLKPGGYKVLLL